MFIPGSIPTNTNLATTTMNNNLHQQQFLFDNLKDHHPNKLSSSMSRKASSAQNFSLDPDLLRELNARYLHDISATRPTNASNSTLDGSGLPAFLLPPFLRAEHYHQHTHTHEHNLNILAPPNNTLLNGNLNNSILDKISKSDNSLSPFLRTTAGNNFSPASLLPPPPLVFPPFSFNNNSTTTATNNNNNNNNNSNNNNSNNNNNNNINNNNTSNHNNNHSTKETPSPPAKKSAKWCAAHVRISWMIYHQQQRSKDKLSPSDNKKDEEQHQQHPQQQLQSSSNNKLPDLISNAKPLLPSSSSATSDLSLPLPPTYPHPHPHLPPPSLNYRSPFDFPGINSGPLNRMPPSSTSAFGGLGSLFPPPPPPPAPSSSSTIDRKPDINGSVAAAAALGLDWSRFHRGMGPSPLIPPLAPLASTNDSLSLKKLDETNNSNHENKKRSSSVLNSDDDRRNPHHHLMLPPSHLTNNNYSSSTRSRSRSPHPSLHHHHHHHHHHSSSLPSSTPSSSLQNKNSSSSPPSSHVSSSSRKRNSPNMKSNISDTSKTSSHLPAPPLPLPPQSSAGLPPVPLPPSFGPFDPLALSIIERQRLTAAYASLFAATSQPNNYFTGNIDPAIFRNNGSANLFPNLDSSAMTAALMQREHFLNSLRQQQEQAIERERSAVAAMNKMSKPSIINMPKIEQPSPKLNLEEAPRISPKLGTSPGSHSSTSSSSGSSKKTKHVKRVKESPSPNVPSTSANVDIVVKEESNVEITPSISTTA